MEDSRDTHLLHVSELCRICGDKNVNKKRKDAGRKPTLCKIVASEILLIYNIDITDEKK